jgi:NAD(P)-dependent dehydrogenase (short-subunit alcohol dehydrogenase family)
MAQPAPCEMRVRGSSAAGPSLAWPMAPAGARTAVVARQRPIEPFEAITVQECHRAFATNVLGPILTVQEALQHFPTSGGSIVTIVTTTHFRRRYENARL